jgi:hypothetical protein
MNFCFRLLLCKFLILILLISLAREVRSHYFTGQRLIYWFQQVRFPCPVKSAFVTSQAETREMALARGICGGL